jgi:hypothetical protein
VGELSCPRVMEGTLLGDHLGGGGANRSALTSGSAFSFTEGRRSEWGAKDHSEAGPGTAVAEWPFAPALVMSRNCSRSWVSGGTFAWTPIVAR